MFCPPDCFCALVDLNNHAWKVSGKLCSGCAFLQYATQLLVMLKIGHSISELLRLKKTLKIIESNH